LIIRCTEQLLFFETISVQFIIKSGEDTNSSSSAVPWITIFHCEKKSTASLGAVCPVNMYLSPQHYFEHYCGGGSVGPVTKRAFRVQRAPFIRSFSIDYLVLLNLCVCYMQKLQVEKLSRPGQIY
jgi:hypothetical protein